ncbi:MAG: hypothetical protein ACW98I_01745 [Candidatus Hodarchaeales archaeon]|jgi:hypothetical protein
MTITEITFSQAVNIGLFGFIFGGIEILTNAIYLLTNNLKLARIQHGRELPSDVNDKIVRHKVVQMLFLGLLLLLIAIISTLMTPQLFIIATALIFLNGLLDYGKFRKIDMFLLWSLITVISIVLLVS